MSAATFKPGDVVQTRSPHWDKSWKVTHGLDPSSLEHGSAELHEDAWVLVDVGKVGTVTGVGRIRPQQSETGDGDVAHAPRRDVVYPVEIDGEILLFESDCIERRRWWTRLMARCRLV
ncbi:MAG: hypothetical protein ACPHRO_10415 [Nannocystaceae bacterium]